jgi:hypothetical protein
MYSSEIKVLSSEYLPNEPLGNPNVNDEGFGCSGTPIEYIGCASYGWLYGACRVVLHYGDIVQP